MDLEFLHTRMLSNQPIFADGVPIYSPKLYDIAKIGTKRYQKNIFNCIVGKEHFDGEIGEDISDYDVLLSFLIHNIKSEDKQEDNVSQFLSALKFFTKSDFQITEINNDLAFVNVDFVLDRNNYSEFKNMIKVANCLDINNKPAEKMDEFDRIAAEIEKEIREAEGKNNEDIPLKDLVSSVANMQSNNLNIINIWDINIYTFYEQMKRGQMFEAYALGLKQILAGADPKNIKLEYYIAKI